MKKILNTILFILLSLILFSCQDSDEERELTRNAYSDRGRTNSNESEGKFYRMTHFVDNTACKDSSGFAGKPLAITSDNFCVATNDGHLGLFSLYDTKWLQKLDSGSYAASSICADPNLNIYAISNKGVLYSFSFQGKLNWKYEMSLPDKKIIVFPDLLALDDGIIASASCGIVEKINYKGEKLWRYENVLSPTMTFAADKKGRIYIPFTHNRFGMTDSLVCINKKGSAVWSVPFENSRIIKTPVAGKDRIYIGGLEDIDDGRAAFISSLDFEGNIKWTKYIEVVPRNISIDNDGNVYITGYNSGLGEPLSYIISYNSDGLVRWDKYFELEISGPTLISETEIAFYGRNRMSRGMYYLTKKGVVVRAVSLSDAPIFIEHPVPTANGTVLFSCIYESSFIRIDETDIDRILPY